MKKTISIIIFFSCFASYPQVIQDWVQSYDGTRGYHDYVYSMAIDTFGNVYVTGTSWGYGTYEDYCTIKYNSVGVQQWVQRYDGPGTGADYALAIAVDDSGNSYVTGYRYNGASASDYDFCTIKYNTNGVQQWITTYNGPENSSDGGLKVAVDSSGNVYVTGFSYGSTGSDYATVKYNSSGVQQWVQRYDGPGQGTDMTSSIAVDDSGNVYITGWSMSTYFSDSEDYTTIKYNSAGVQQWIQRYDGLENDEDEAKALAIDASGNVYVTGWSWSDGVNYATIKYNSSGVQQWLQLYQGPIHSTDQATAIAVDKSGNVYVTGWSYGIGEDYATVKYNTTGIQQWVTRYDAGSTAGIFTDEANAIALDTSGNVYVTGYSYGNTTNYDCVTVKYDSAGVEKWVQRYNGTGNDKDYGMCIAVNASGNVYVSGYSVGVGGSFDYVTIKYLQSITDVSNSLEIPKDYSLFQNYPNPFNPSTTIQFQIPNSTFVNLKVYDVLGNNVATLVNEEKPAGSYDIEFKSSVGSLQLASGIYFYKLQAGSFIDTRKMILLK